MPTPASLSSILFPAYRQQVMTLLLLHPERSYHLREMARLTGAAPGALARELHKLADAGLLHRIAVGNQVHYSADRSCPIFEELASIARKTFGLSDVLTQCLAPWVDHIDVAFVFGSIATGAASASSDVDLMVIGKLGFDDLIGAVHPMQDQLAREINPKIYKPAEWRKLVAQRSAFARDVLSKPKLFVVGNESDLYRMGGHA